MPAIKEIQVHKWDDLPAQTRQVLSKQLRKIDKSTDPKNRPIIAMAKTGKAGVYGWGFLALFCLFPLWINYKTATHSFFASGDASRSPGIGSLVMLMLPLFGLLYSIAAGYRRWLLNEQLPYHEGKYLYALDVIDATAESITITPMSLLKTVKITEHLTNGAYQYTDFALLFSTGTSASFIVGRKDPDTIQETLKSERQQIVAALESGDEATLKRLDPLYALRMDVKEDGAAFVADVPKSPQLPAWMAKRLPLAAVGALGLSVLGYGVLWYGFQRALWDYVQDRDEPLIYKTYISSKGLYRKEATPLMYKAAFAQAHKDNTVGAYRQMLRQHPETPFAEQAKQEIHKIFGQSWGKLSGRLDTRKAAISKAGLPAEETEKLLAESQKATVFWGRLFEHLEKSGDSRVEVLFAPPLVDSLAKVDASLGAADVAPIAPHFSATTSASRQAAILAALARSLNSIVPGDVISLVEPEVSSGADAIIARLGSYSKKPKQAPRPPGGLPSLNIKYMVSPTSSIYKSTRPGAGRGFVGIRVDFLVNFVLPGEKSGLPLFVSVLPPQRFTVSSSRVGQADDGQVYSVMAERAFDQLQEKLAGVLFGEPSKLAPAPPAPPPATAPMPATSPSGKKSKRRR